MGSPMEMEDRPTCDQRQSGKISVIRELNSMEPKWGVLSALKCHKIGDRFALSYQAAFFAVHQDFRGARAGVVVRRQRHAIRTGVEDGEKIAFLRWRQFAIAGEEVATLADGPNDIDFGERVAVGTESNGHD